MGNFFKNVLAVLVALLLYTGFIFGFGFLIIASISSADFGNKPVTIKENSILHLSLTKDMVERASKQDPFQDLDLPFGGGGGKIGLTNVVEAIKKAKTDDNIKGIYFDASSVNAGFASLEVVRKALIDFKSSGKFIISYAEIMTEGAYYLASVSDEIYLFPEGIVEFNGLASEIMYFTGLFEKLGVKMEIFKVGDFKSAVEPFFRKDMSDYNRQQTTSFLNSLYDHYLNNVAKSLGKSYDELKLVSDSMFVRDGEDAKKYGLVTDLAYWDQVEDRLKAKTDSSLEKLRFVSIGKYTKHINSKKTKKSGGKDGKNKVAVIIAEGDIISGKSVEGSMGSETISEALRKARKDTTIKAVVLRVNSPGGSALASDVMWREVELIKKEKPIIASMSDVAASGGYYISMSCDKIVAEPNTITGSIGVFGMIPIFKGFFNDKLGVTFDRVKTGQFSDVPNVNRDMTEYEKRYIQEGVNDTYAKFTEKAAQGRNMHVDSLRKIASGRVWSGIEAKERGLVDVLGGLEEAIDIAAEEARLDSNYTLIYYPKEKDFFEQIFENLEEDAKVWFEDETLADLKPYIKSIKEIKKYEGIQARMPFEFKMR